MAGSTIGIKIADGSYYPVLEEGFTGTKRLTLTTVNDNQDRVQIDLYRGDGRTLESAQYIGSLVIENIAPAGQGEPEIELVIGIDAEGELTAEAVDRSTGETQSFAVSLGSVAEGEPSELPEFAVEPRGEAEKAPEEGALSEVLPEIPETAAPGREAAGFEEEPLTGEAYPVGDVDRRREHLRKPAAARERAGAAAQSGRRRLSPGLAVLFVVLGLLVVAAVAYVVISTVMGPSFLPLPFGIGEAIRPGGAAAGSAAAPAAAAAVPSAAGTAKPAATTPAASTTSVAAAKPAAAASKGVTYRIKWGDTLWDIAATYYRNPWLYPRIAKANRIENPDLIIAGTRLFIPEQ